MSVFKREYVRLPKALQAASGRSCIRCGRQDGTTVRAHYTGVRQHAFGKGRGIKCDDHCAADLCMRCHSDLDSPYRSKSIDASEEFMYLCLLTIARDINDGILIEARTVGKDNVLKIVRNDNATSGTDGR